MNGAFFDQFPVVVVISGFILAPSTQLDIAGCTRDLGVESGGLPDSALSASSSYDPLNVGPQHARLGQDTGGGAWCPRDPVGPDPDTHHQWLGVNLTSPHVITSVLTQGRYAQGQGQEYTMAFRITYWRPGMAAFKEYRDSVGRNILLGNSDTFNVATNLLNPPLIASAIRILPYSNHSRTVCLRVGLVGCPFEESLLSYSVPQGMVRGATLELLDITYDGLEDSLTGLLTGGLGQLVDGKYGAENYRAVGENGIVRGYEWVGWKNKSMGPLQMDFTFMNIRKFDQIYFSNEEGKFGDDRAVDYIYMPDTMVEDARNVSINLHGEHGKYVMMQLFFSDKWMLISEISFISSKYEAEKPSGLPEKFPSASNNNQINLNEIDENKIPSSYITESATSYTAILDDSTMEFRRVQTEAPEVVQYSSSHAGLIIGILLTIISLLIGAILYVVYQARLRSNKPGGSMPQSHTAAAITDKIQRKLAASLDFEDFTATYKAKMRVYGQVSALDTADESKSVTLPRGNLDTGLPRYGHSDGSDDYAEPHACVSAPPVVSPRPPEEQIYQSVMSVPGQGISRSSVSSPGSSLDLVNPRAIYSTCVNTYQQPTYQKITKKYQQRSSSQNIYQSVNNCHSLSKVETHDSRPELNVVRKSQLKIVERLGSGRFGEAHLCYFIGSQSSALVVVKSLEASCSFEKRREFEQEARLLSLPGVARDPNIAPVLGANMDENPSFVIREFSEQGDLAQFLQNHVSESSGSPLSDIPTLSYGALMYMAAQIASGMKCLESYNIVHKDLATRNCQVYSGYHIKISDIGSVRSLYKADYFHLVPIRWTSWEALIRGQYGSKSDVWSFGVTLWEILTFAREQPFEQLSDREVVENLQEMADAGLVETGDFEVLYQPYNCARDVYDLMLECWAKHTEDRPDFQEISLFLMRKNLGFDPSYD